jgi:hypothetical protein
VGFWQAWRGDESSLNVCAPPQIDFDDKGQPKNRLSRTTLLISSEYHCNHPSASLANRKLKSLSWYNGQISILFPGVLHIFVECGHDLLSTSEPQRVQDIKSYYSPNILFYSSGCIYYVLSCLVACIIHISKLFGIDSASYNMQASFRISQGSSSQR